MNGPEVSAADLRRVTGAMLAGERPERLGVAVSGGGDSMALLDLMAWHGQALGFEVFAVSVDHGLRAEAKDECARVAAYCSARAISHSVLQWTGWDGSGNLQAAARDARFALIADWAQAQSVACVALGHTADDQAETVILRLARGAGVDGLAGMPSDFARGGLRFIRPLLSVRRDALRAYLRGQAIGWSEDISNADERFARVRVRKAADVLENLGVDTLALTQVAGNAAAARDALDHYLHLEVAEKGLVEDHHGDLIVLGHLPDADGQVPFEIRRRAVIAALRWIGGGIYPPRTQAIKDLFASVLENAQHTLNGCVVMPVEDGSAPLGTFRITREFQAVRALVGPTECLWDNRWVFDGPHEKSLEIRALGEAVTDTPWRETGLPRASVMASPAVWRGTTLIAAPVAGLANGWTAKATGRGKFTDFLLWR